ncbi:hypothetical protein QFZ58_000170 [Streptomyces sp. B1I3]|nr:hypothetical protein [Streptomyces sp. B1I3]
MSRRRGQEEHDVGGHEPILPGARRATTARNDTGQGWTAGQPLSWSCGSTGLSLRARNETNRTRPPPAASAPAVTSYDASVLRWIRIIEPEGVGVLSLTHNADGYLDEGGAVATWPVEGGLRAASAGLAEPGDSVRVRWDAREDGVLELPATLVSVRRGSAADLAGLDLDLNVNERRGIPYYVSVTYTDTGPKGLYTGQADHVRLLTESGR